MRFGTTTLQPTVLGFVVGVVATGTLWSIWDEQQRQGDGAGLWKATNGVVSVKTTTPTVPPVPDAEEEATHVPTIPDGRWPISFMHQPDTFLKTFETCESDDHCKVIFHHVYKTGGTTIEKTMSEIWHQPHNNSCCNEQRMRNFFKNRDYYCGNKFSSHQVNATDFYRAVSACFSTDKASASSRFVLLTTFREPNQMLLSQIHQMCNKNYFRRPQYIIDTCKACDYNKGTEVWDKMIQDVTDQLHSAWLVSRVFLGSLNRSVSLPLDTKILTLEASDISNFFGRFKPDLDLPQANKERLGVCEFRISSEMARRLRDAQFYYRQLVANVDYH